MELDEEVDVEGLDRPQRRSEHGDSRREGSGLLSGEDDGYMFGSSREDVTEDIESDEEEEEEDDIEDDVEVVEFVESDMIDDNVPLLCGLFS